MKIKKIYALLFIFLMIASPIQAAEDGTEKIKIEEEPEEEYDWGNPASIDDWSTIDIAQYQDAISSI